MFRHTNAKAAINNKIDNRVNKYEGLYEELKRRGVRDYDDIYTIFTVHEIMNFNGSIGLQCREIAKQAIQAISREDLLLKQIRTYLENLQEKRHDCYADSEENIQRGVDWLEFMFNMNHIPVHALLTDIIKILDMKVNKVNCLCSYGQANTGKTLLANLIASHLTVSDQYLIFFSPLEYLIKLWSLIGRRGDQTAFHFDNLLNRTVALMEEPRITMTTKNDYKNLLGGDSFEIDVKHSARRFLKRIHVIATTKEELAWHKHSVERNALMSRVKQYTLNEQISSELIHGSIRPPPNQLCACHLREHFTRYGLYEFNVV